MRNEKMFDALAWRLHKRGVRPDHLTFLQAPFLGALAWAAYRNQLYWFALIQITIIVIDGADGMLARRTGTTTRRGHLLDSVFDILGIGITLGAVSFLHPAYANWAYALLFVNFLVYLQNEIQDTKSITYTRGPVTVGLLLAPRYPQLLLLSLLMPLSVGLLLLFTRVDWRRRLWNWYQFLTAGRRGEYKATPRAKRASLVPPPGRSEAPPAPPADSNPTENAPEHAASRKSPPPLS